MKGVLQSTVLLLFLLVMTGCGASSGISVKGAWARNAQKGSNTAVYLIIGNQGPPDQLLSVETEIASGAQLHRSLLEGDGTVRMQAQPWIEIPADARVQFEPGGYHLMLMDLKEDLDPGADFDLQLNFERHGPVSIQVEVHAP